MQLRLVKIFEGNEPLLGGIEKYFDTSAFVSQISEWQFIENQDSELKLESSNNSLNGYRGPRMIAADISEAAAVQLGLCKSGWYQTDLTLDYF